MLVYIDRCIYRFQLQLKFEAIAVMLLLEMRPSLFVMVEQPSGSWGLKQDFMLKLMAAFGMCPGSARIILGCLFFSKNICWLAFVVEQPLQVQSGHVDGAVRSRPSQMYALGI